MCTLFRGAFVAVFLFPNPPQRKHHYWANIPKERGVWPTLRRGWVDSQFPEVCVLLMRRLLPPPPPPPPPPPAATLYIYTSNHLSHKWPVKSTQDVRAPQTSADRHLSNNHGFGLLVFHCTAKKCSLLCARMRHPLFLFGVDRNKLLFALLGKKSLKR